ncbi:MAG: MBL fold metallo-hydrolase [Candidatus Thermoplasmatota archaeon]|nr:MBL fold metallo-hydrolase [Candidatus Thermoplasmatota archaeon]MBS3790219.1 MBL fold metallo-hydrolase [Candidatus Thermoplasmatota archaeon]
MDKIDVKPIWSDSMGAKSMCVKVQTSDTSILVDPAAAVMQKSYPMKTEKKYTLLDRARTEIESAAEDVEQVFVSHYHYDHHFLPETSGIDFSKVFGEKELWIKDPNRWINPSQWNRSRKFLQAILDINEEKRYLEDFKFEPDKEEYKDPLKCLPLLQEIDEGDYSERREELHGKWREKFFDRVKMWNDQKHVEEPRDDVHFADGQTIKQSSTKIRFTDPLFHGIEYSKTGWVLGLIIEKGDEKFIYTSDVQGPTIEDYSKWIIEEDPDFIIVDGPATYLLGYMLNNFNLERSIQNAENIVNNCSFETMIYDHHITRESGFREKTKEIWRSAEEAEGEVLTFREYLKDKRPIVEEID